MPVNFDRSFDEIAIAMGRAANERSVAPASSVAERHGLIERGEREAVTDHDLGKN